MYACLIFSTTLSKTKVDFVSYATFPVLNLKEELRYVVCLSITNFHNFLNRDLIITLKKSTACGTIFII